MSAESMLDVARLREALELQKRSYTLLQWLSNAIPRGFISFDTAHDYADSAKSAFAWIREHFDNLPAAARPPARDDETIQRFANCFASYLEASFDLVEDPGVRVESECGCFCPHCVMVSAAPHLKAKRLGRPDKARAQKLEGEVVRDLAARHGLVVEADALEALVADRTVREEAALVAYAQQLQYRCDGTYVGPWALALWRTFAWLPTGSPKQDFELTWEKIVDAENALIERISKRALANADRD